MNKPETVSSFWNVGYTYDTCSYPRDGVLKLSSYIFTSPHLEPEDSLLTLGIVVDLLYQKLQLFTWPEWNLNFKFVDLVLQHISWHYSFVQGWWLALPADHQQGAVWSWCDRWPQCCTIWKAHVGSACAKLAQKPFTIDWNIHTHSNDNTQLVHCQLMHAGGHTKNTLMKRFITSVNDTARDLSNWAAMTGKNWTETQVKKDPIETLAVTFEPSDIGWLLCVLTISDNTFSNATI